MLGLVVFWTQVLAMNSRTETAHQSDKEKDSPIEHLCRSDGSRWASVVLTGRWTIKSN